MKKRKKVIQIAIILVFTTIEMTIAQNDNPGSKFTTGADLYSSYVWRGSKFGKGPSVQPAVRYINGGLVAGVWGAFDAAGYSETDPYIQYTFTNGIILGVTDYYYPSLRVFDFSKISGSHALELSAGFSKERFNLSANYIVNEAGGAGSSGGDFYLQGGLTYNSFNLFAGAGNGWYTSDGRFAFCNIGFGTSKEIKLTESFSIPVVGQIILNPEKEQLFVVVGFAF